MPMFQSLDSAAQRLTGHADEVRARAAQLSASVAQTDWNSPAARVFRTHTDATSQAMRRCANDIDAAAGALHSLAGTARGRFTAAAGLALEAIDGAEQAGAAIVGGMEHAVGFVASWF